MLVRSLALYPKKDIEYIRRLKTLNRYYDKAVKLDQIPERVKEAYLLSKEQLAPLHDSSKTSRLLYYKLLIAQKSYREAINIVQENIALVGPSEDEQFRLYHYLKQLYSLYGLTGQLPQEEQTLLTFLALDKRLVGSPAEEQIQIIILLAQNYCLQKSLASLESLVTATVYSTDAKPMPPNNRREITTPPLECSLFNIHYGPLPYCIAFRGEGHRLGCAILGFRDGGGCVAPALFPGSDRHGPLIDQILPVSQPWIARSVSTVLYSQRARCCLSLDTSPAQQKTVLVASSIHLIILGNFCPSLTKQVIKKLALLHSFCFPEKVKFINYKGWNLTQGKRLLLPQHRSHTRMGL